MSYWTFAWNWNLRNSARAKGDRSAKKTVHRAIHPRMDIELLETRRLLAAPALAGLYHTYAAFTQSRSDFATVSVGHDVLFAGGDYTDSKNNAFVSDEVDIYHATTGQWSTAHLARARTHITDVIVSGTKAILIGGQSGPDFRSQPINKIDIFDSTTNVWTSTDIPQPQRFRLPIVAGNQLIFAGGGDTIGDQYIPTNEVDIYHLNTGLWTTATLSNTDFGIAGVSIGTTAIFVSGNGHADVYDSVTGTWSTASLSGSNFSTRVVVAGKAAFFSSNSVDIYDPLTKGWSTAANPFGSVNITRPAIIAGTKVIFDGGGEGGVITGAIPYDSLVFDVIAGTWTRHPEPYIRTPSATTVGSKAIFAGGAGVVNIDGFHTTSAAIDIYDAATDQWSTSVAQLSEARSDMSAFATGHLAVFGPGHGSFFGSPTALVDVYDDLTGVWSSTKLSPESIGTGATSVDGQLLFAASKGVDLFIQSNIAEPSNPSPPDASGTSDSPSTFTWDASPEADHYDVYIDEVFVANVTQPQWTNSGTLQPGHHRWQVVARAGSSLTAGPQWSFDIGAPEIPSQPTPSDGAALSVTPATLTWQSSSGASSYDLYVDGTLFGNVASNHSLLGKLLSGGSHTWQVIARNAFTTTAGPIWHFTTPLSGLTRTTKQLSNSRSIAIVSLKNVALFASNEHGGYDTDSRTVDIFDATSHHWLTGKLSVARSSISTASVGNKAIFAGGIIDYPNFEPTTVVDLYDATTHRWSTASLSKARIRMTTVSVGTDALFAGGSIGNDISGVVDIYHSKSGRWSTANLSKARAYFVTASAGHLAFFAGGVTDPLQSSTTLSDIVDIYDAKTRHWSTAHLSVARFNIFAISVGSKVLFAGGNDNQIIPSNIVDIYDTVTGHWSTSTLPEARTGLSGVVVGHRVIFAGGSAENPADQATRVSDLVEIYDADTGRWSTQKLGAARNYETVVQVGTKVLIAGGSADFPADYSNVVDVFDLRSKSWTVQTLANSSIQGTATAGDVAIFAESNSSGDNITTELFSPRSQKKSHPRGARDGRQRGG